MRKTEVLVHGFLMWPDIIRKPVDDPALTESTIKPQEHCFLKVDQGFLKFEVSAFSEK